MKWKTRAFVVGGMVAAGMVVGGVSFAAAPLPSVSVGPKSANGTALGVPGTLSVSESNATSDGDGGGQSNWSALTVAGTSVLGRSSAPGSNTGEWTGPAAPAGAVIDAVNNSPLCPTTTTDLPGGGYEYLCIEVLPSRAPDPTSFGPFAQGDVVGVVLFSQDATGASRSSVIEVLPADASVGRGGCQTNEAQSAILRGFINAPELTHDLNIGVMHALYDPCATP